MDQASTQPESDALPDEPAPGHGHDEGSWIAPAWAIRRIAPLILKTVARGAPAPELEAALAEARAKNAILLANARHLVAISAAFGDRVRMIIDDGRRYDGLAALASACGTDVLRPAGLSAAEIAAGQAVPVLLLPDRGAHESAIDLLTSLARPVLPVLLRQKAAARTWRTGLATPVSIPAGSPDAGHGPILSPPENAVMRAQFAATIEPMLGREADTLPVQAEPMGGLAGGPLLRAYALATKFLSLFTIPYLLVRMRSGKEDRKRLGERRGRTHTERPEGRLAWIHAASVGESLSILPLVRHITERGLADNVLLTTGTVTSAAMMQARASQHLIHQFIPLDVPRYARRFLDHWHPDAAIFVESEIWPNLMAETALRQVPFCLINARMSERSFSKWQRWPQSARAALATLDLVLAQSEPYAQRFARLGARDVRHIGNLKFDCPAPPFNEASLEAVRGSLEGRPCWLAASTHDGEEDLVAEAHFAIRERFPNILTIIVPRHPDRAANVAKLLEERWLVTARRSAAEEISAKIDVYIADTMGELGLFYRLADAAFIGGSLVETGGHNPIEPAQLDCAIVHGPHVHNFADTYAALDAAGGAVSVATSGELANQIADLISNEERCAGMVAASRVELTRNAGTVERALELLAPRFAA